MALFHIYRRDGTHYPKWRGRVIWKRAADGILATPTDVWADTEREAHSKREAAQAKAAAEAKALLEGRSVNDKRSLSAYLKAEYFPRLELECQQGMKGRSRGFVDGKMGRFRNYFMDPKKCPKIKSLAIYTISMINLRPTHIQEFFDALLMAKISDNVRVSIKHDWTMLLKRVSNVLPQSPYDYWLWCEHSPVTIAEQLPKVSWPIESVLKALNNPQVAPMYRVAVGILLDCLRRPEEMWPLTWDDVDFVNGTVSFNKALRRGPDRGLVVGPIKTGNRGARTIEPHALIMDALRELHATRGRSPYLFTTDAGGRMSNDTWSNTYWPRGRKEMSLDDSATFYSLKTLGNTWQDMLGVPDTHRAWKAGHSTTRMVSHAYNATGGREVAHSKPLLDAAMRLPIAQAPG